MDKSGVLTYRGSPASYRYVDGQAMDHATWGGDAQRAAVLASTDHEGAHRTPSAQPAAPCYVNPSTPTLSCTQHMVGTRQQALLTVKMEQHVGARYCPLPHLQVAHHSCSPDENLRWGQRVLDRRVGAPGAHRYRHDVPRSEATRSRRDPTQQGRGTHQASHGKPGSGLLSPAARPRHHHSRPGRGPRGRTRWSGGHSSSGDLRIVGGPGGGRARPLPERHRPAGDRAH